MPIGEESECPIEYGVIYTRWGPVQAGTLLAGIASAFQVEFYKVGDNLDPIDSRYAVTLVGTCYLRFFYIHTYIYRKRKEKTDIVDADVQEFIPESRKKTYLIIAQKRVELSKNKLRIL